MHNLDSSSHHDPFRRRSVKNQHKRS
jgi:hypothetical protein